jgi:hypothetical protein
MELTQDRLKELLHYAPETGLFTWKVKSASHILVGDIIDGIDLHGYTLIGIGYKNFKAHRLAFLYMLGRLPKEVDHINRIRHDNRWSNLREVTRAENMWNRKINTDNNYGVKGLTFLKTKQLWLGQIQTNGKRVSKSNKDRNIIETWLKETRVQLHKEFANHG